MSKPFTRTSSNIYLVNPILVLAGPGWVIAPKKFFLVVTLVKTGVQVKKFFPAFIGGCLDSGFRRNDTYCVIFTQPGPAGTKMNFQNFVNVLSGPGQYHALPKILSILRRILFL